VPRIRPCPLVTLNDILAAKMHARLVYLAIQYGTTAGVRRNALTADTWQRLGDLIALCPRAVAWLECPQNSLALSEEIQDHPLSSAVSFAIAGR
jgi:hypothetical protein